MNGTIVRRELAYLAMAIAGSVVCASAAVAIDQQLLEILLQNRAISRDQYERLLAPKEEAETPPADRSGATTDKALLDTLLANGVISRDQYDRLLGRDTELAAPPPTPESVEDAAPPTPDVEPAAPRVVVDRKGLTVQSPDGEFAMNIAGRVHVQASGHRGDDDIPDEIGVQATDGTEIRRARIELDATIFRDWLWVAEVDFANDETSIKDFTLGYSALPANGYVALGNQKQPYSLAVEMSSNDIPFIERAVDNYLIIPFIDRAVGLRGEVSGEHWFFATGIYGESVEPTGFDDEGWGSAGRLVVAPVLQENAVLHLGARAAYRRPSRVADLFILRDETTNMSNLRIVNTGPIENVHDVVLVGPEAAVAYGPVSVYGEYNHAFINRQSSPDLDFDSWHVAGTWTLTGESRAAAYRIDSGEFKRLQPRRNLDFHGGGWGAWEVAERLAYIDLNDGPITGGDEMVVTTALNWYLNPVVRFMFEWSRIVDTDESNEVRVAAEGMDIFQFRGQFAF